MCKNPKSVPTMKSLDGVNKKNELHNRNLHISELLNEEKVDIGDAKVDIESVLSEKGSDFSVKTTVHIHRLFENLCVAFSLLQPANKKSILKLKKIKKLYRLKIRH